MTRLAKFFAPLFLLAAITAGAQDGQPAQQERPNREQRPSSERRPATVRNSDQQTTEQAREGQQQEGGRQRGRRNQEGQAQEGQGKPGEEKPAEEAPAGRPPAAARPQATPRPAAAPAGPSLGELSASINRETGMLRLHAVGRGDRQDATVIVGEELVTNITYGRNSVIPFDEIRVILSYEPDKLEPISINDAPIAKYIEGQPTAEIDSNFGMLLYEASLKEPASVVNAPVLTIRWKTLRVTAGTRIEFSRRDEFQTALNLENKDLLGNPREAGDGTLDMTAVILPEDPRMAEALLTDPKLYTTSDEKIGGVRLSLQPQEEPIVVGVPFAVDVVLDNRASSMLDGLNLYIEFDPNVIQIIDADLDNWITRETNIHDGPFRKEYPWDFHVDNIVWNRRGLITYRVGTSAADMVRGRTGTIARIHGVAKSATQGTAFFFKFSENPRANATSVRYIGQDVLGDPKVYNDGASGVLLPVSAAPPSQVTSAQ